MDDTRLRPAHAVGIKLDVNRQDWRAIRFDPGFDGEFFATAMFDELVARHGHRAAELLDSGTISYVLINPDAPEALESASQILDMIEDGDRIDEDLFYDRLHKAKCVLWIEMTMAQRIEVLKHEHCDLADAYKTMPPDELDEYLETEVRGY